PRPPRPSRPARGLPARESVTPCHSCFREGAGTGSRAGARSAVPLARVIEYDGRGRDSHKVPAVVVDGDLAFGRVALARQHLAGQLDLRASVDRADALVFQACT